MNNFKGTPGPWVAEQTHSMLWIWDLPKQKIVMSCHNEVELKKRVIEENKANATLIAAAPEMLEAMQEFVDRVDKGEVRSTKTYSKFKSIITKATAI